MTVPIGMNILAAMTCLWLWRLQATWPCLPSFARRMRTLVGLTMAAWTYVFAFAWLAVAIVSGLAVPYMPYP